MISNLCFELLGFFGGVFLLAGLFGDRIDKINKCINIIWIKSKYILYQICRAMLLLGCVGIFISLMIFSGPAKDDHMAFSKVNFSKYQDFEDYKVFLVDSGILFWLYQIFFYSILGVFVAILFLQIGKTMPGLLKKKMVRFICIVLAGICYLIRYALLA